jgi:tripartite ATP-independent transporter DctM subunit
MELWAVATLVIFGMVFLFLFIGMPVAGGLGIAAIIGGIIFLGKFGIAAYVPWEVGDSFVLTAIPLFIFMGEVLLRSGLSIRLYDGAAAVLGRLPGGLLHANIGSCAIFAAISGSSLATAATIGTVALPELEKRGYENKIACGSLAAGGTLGILIPPSISMIIIGAMTEQSIAKLFIAGVFPGIMLVGLFMSYIVVRVIIQPQLAPRFETIPLKRRALNIIRMWPVMVIMLFVLGGIYLGVTTPTEAAAVGAFMAMVFALIYRKLNWLTLKASMLGAVKITAMLLFIIVGAMILSGMLGLLKVPFKMVAWVASLPLPPLAILIGIYIMYLFLGCFLDGLALVVLTVPIVFPIIRELGFDTVWFAVALVILVECCLLTPPVGTNVYVIHGLRPGRPMSEVILGAMPFFFMMLVGLAIITAFPQIATWLPGTMY